MAASVSKYSFGGLIRSVSISLRAIFSPSVMIANGSLWSYLLRVILLRQIAGNAQSSDRAAKSLVIKKRKIG